MDPSNFKSIINKVFAHDLFNKLDKKSLLDKFDTTEKIDKINSRLGSVGGQIRQTSFIISMIPPQGIVIKDPGIYTFADNITWEPEDTASIAILIESSDVVLDFDMHNLTATIQDNSKHITGVYIQNANNVIIQNGALVNMCFYGIRAKKVENLTIKHMTVSGLDFNNLNSRNLCPSGIHINYALGVVLDTCTVQYMYVAADSSAGIQILNTIGGKVSGCNVNNLVNYDGSVQGYSYILTTDIVTTDCYADNFQSHFNGNIRTMGHTVLGFIPIFSYNLIFENCSATKMTGCSDDCHGMSVFLDANIKVTNFSAKYVTDGVTPANTGAKATGLEVYGANVSICKCSAENIKSINPQDKQSTGFSAWGTNISFDGCNASNVIVCDQNGNKNPDLGYGTGFGWAPDPRILFRNTVAQNVKYNGCKANKCQVGFDTWFHVDSTWTDITCTDCDIKILVEPEGTRTLSCNPASECNPPITVTIKNIAKGNTYPGSKD